MRTNPSKLAAFLLMPLRKKAGTGVSFACRRAAVTVCCTLALIAAAQDTISEDAIKAAYVFNFGKFVRYAPSDAVSHRQNFTICIVGEDPLGHTLDDLTAHEHLGGKPLRVERLESAEEGRNCSIAYISSAEGHRIGSDLEALHGYEVLTVSDAPEFLRRGGMIQFVTEEKHVRFAVNLDAVRREQLTLSSELLRIAVTVRGEKSPEVGP